MSHPIHETIASIRGLQHFHQQQGLPADSSVQIPLDDAGAMADMIERLEAVVRAAENYIDIFNMHKIGRMSAAADAYKAARHRVNLSSQAPLDNSVSDGHESTDRCGDDCTLEVLRPGQVQCNRDGAKCPNREASNGKET